MLEFSVDQSLHNWLTESTRDLVGTAVPGPRQGPRPVQEFAKAWVQDGPGFAGAFLY